MKKFKFFFKIITLEFVEITPLSEVNKLQDSAQHFVPSPVICSKWGILQKLLELPTKSYQLIENIHFDTFFQVKRSITWFYLGQFYPFQ